MTLDMALEYYSANLLSFIEYFMKTFNLNSAQSIQISKVQSGSTII